MILCIDSGNTRLKWGLRALGASSWLAQGSVWQRDFLSTPERLCQALNPLISQHSLDEVWVSHVASPTILAALEALFRTVLLAPVYRVHSQEAACGVTNGYQFPEKLGVDRWCALLGARGLTTDACIVVMAGTATTIDTLTATGHFQGGMILPGSYLMKQSLAKETAALPWAEGQHQPWPGCTQDAIVTGCLEAQAGAIERAFARIVDQPGAQVLLSGGGAEALAVLLSCPLRAVENLVMEGLWRMAEASR